MKVYSLIHCFEFKRRKFTEYATENNVSYECKLSFYIDYIVMALCFKVTMKEEMELLFKQRGIVENCNLERKKTFKDTLKVKLL